VIVNAYIRRDIASESRAEDFSPRPETITDPTLFERSVKLLNATVAV
jgi:hypothetical protein